MWPVKYTNAHQLGVTSFSLTDEGKTFFGMASMRLYEFHQRKVNNLQPGFKSLAENNQILLSDSGYILTFQGHPEMTKQLMHDLLMSPRSCEAGYVRREMQQDNTIEARAQFLEKVDAEHDGLNIWKKILEWIVL